MELIKKITRILSIVVIILTATQFSLLAEGIDFFHGTFDEAKEKAKKEGKLIFVDAYASWCGPCKRMAANVFPLDEVGEFYNQHFVNLKIDMEKGEGRSLASLFRVSAYPTLLYINGDGNIVHRSVGGKSPFSLIEEGKKALLPSGVVIDKLKDQYANGQRTPEFLAQYAEVLFKSGEPHEAVFKEYLNTQTSETILNDKNCKLIMMLTNSVSSIGNNYLKSYRQYYIDTYGADKFYNTIENVAKNSTKDAIKTSDEKILNEGITYLRSMKHPDSKELAYYLEMEFAQEKLEWETYHSLAKKYVKKYAFESEKKLKSVVEVYYDRISDPEIKREAEPWALQLTKLNDNIGNNMFYAEVLMANKKWDDALVYAQYAEKLANDSGNKTNNPKKLIQKIRDAQAQE